MTTRRWADFPNVGDVPTTTMVHMPMAARSLTPDDMLPIPGQRLDADRWRSILHVSVLWAKCDGVPMLAIAQALDAELITIEGEMLSEGKPFDLRTALK